MAQRLDPRLLADPVHLLALGFGTGLSPKAPGTAGTLLALPFTWLLIGAPLVPRLAIILAVVLAGIAICGASARRIGVHDHPGIVFDEIAAMLSLALVLTPDLRLLAAAFLLFRFFDIVKPWPIRDLDHRLHGGLGIMLDDVLAALYAGVCLKIFEFLQGFT